MSIYELEQRILFEGEALVQPVEFRNLNDEYKI